MPVRSRGTGKRTARGRRSRKATHASSLTESASAAATLMDVSPTQAARPMPSKRKRLREILDIDPIDLGDDSDANFRRIGQTQGLRDLSSITHERMQELAFAMSRTNPLAQRN